MDTNHPNRLAKDVLLRGHMPELDTLRGVAILLVVFFHGLWSEYGAKYSDLSGCLKIIAGVSRAGWLGVHLFFVLSGFLITGILYESRKKPHYYKVFYVRRAMRILPIFLLVLLILYATRRVSPLFAGISLLFLGNVAHFFGRAIEYTPLWSLAVEEQFYLVWPTFVRRCGANALMAFLISAILAAPVGRMLAFHAGYGDRELYFYSWFNFDCLAFGALAAVALRQEWATVQMVQRIAAVMGTVGILLVLVFLRHGLMTRTRLAGAMLEYPVAGLLFTSLLLTVLLLGSGRGFRPVNIRVLQFYGYISYGLYLIHLLIFEYIDHRVAKLGLAPQHLSIGFVMLKLLAGLALATGLAWLSRKYYEEYFLRRKNQAALAVSKVRSEGAICP